MRGKCALLFVFISALTVADVGSVSADGVPASSASSSSSTTRPALMLDIQLDEARAVPAEGRVWIKVIVENRSPSARRIIESDVFDVYRFEVILPDGKEAPLTLRGRDEQQRPSYRESVTKSIAPGARSEEDVLLSRYFDMTKLGEYRIRVWRRTLAPEVPTGFDFVPSPWISVTVVSVDEAASTRPSTREF
jgi:hypothetical protein